MQVEIIKVSKRTFLTIDFSPATLRKLCEPELLRLAVTIYQSKHLLENAHKSLPLLLGRTQPWLVACLEGRTFIGAEAWLRLEEEISIDLYRKWLEAKTKK